MSHDILKVKNLRISYPCKKGVIPVVDDISFKIKESEIVGVVGESGSGKTQTALSVIRLLKQTALLQSSGVFLNGSDILKLSEKEMCKIRGGKISMIFQEPMSSLNPVFTIGSQIKEALSCHKKYTRSELKEKTLELLELVKINDPERRVKEYPHQLSGGMRQRVMIAIALASGPDLLIADEPTTALDVTIQAQILELLKDLQDKMGLSILFITHDLGVVAELCDYVLIMYAGKIVEKGPIKSIFTNPRHPYTKALLSSIPKIGDVTETLPVMPGKVFSHEDLSLGCTFYQRCSLRKDCCLLSFPTSEKIDDGHYVSCFSLQ